MMEKDIDIQIKGKAYKIKTDLEEKEIKEIEKIVNETISECEKLIENPEGPEKVYVLALLSMAEKILKDKYKKKNMEERLQKIIDKIEEKI
jgi:cell division protein ZapA (FtsZ GTPase activity inhibitor)